MGRKQEETYLAAKRYFIFYEREMMIQREEPTTHKLKPRTKNNRFTGCKIGPNEGIGGMCLSGFQNFCGSMIAMYLLFLPFLDGTVCMVIQSLSRRFSLRKLSL